MTDFGDRQIYNFRDSVSKQIPYKERFMQWLRSRPKVREVRVADRESDLRGVDFYLTNEDGEVMSIQLKVDFKADRTGNLPCETISQAYSWRNSVIGAEFNMSEVDYIFFLLIPSKRILCFRFKDFLEYVIQHYKYLKNFDAPNDNDGVQYQTLGCLVPIKQINHLVIFNGNLI